MTSSESDICVSPGCTDGSAWLVKSTILTHQRPFLWSVERQAKCHVRRTVHFFIPAVCVHTLVTVAKKKGCLDSLVKWLSKRDNLNDTKLANSGLP